MTNFRLAKRVTAVPPSGIRRFFDIVATMHDVISLGIGEPDFVTPASITQAGVDSLAHGETHYTSNSGIEELRVRLGQHLDQLYGVRYSPDEILITVGVSEALHLAMLALLDPGDECILTEPSYVAYLPSVIFAGGVPVVVETHVEDNFEVTAEQLEKVVTPKTRMLLLGYPNNPTGAVMPRARLLEIAQLAERHNLVVLSDEIYDRLVYGTEHVCVPSLPGMRERTILLGGFSKAYAMTGWRIGYACGPEELLGAMRKIHQYIIMSAPTTGQAAAIEALKHGEPFVKQMVAEYDQRRQLIVRGLNTIGLHTFEPRGAFYAFPDIRSTGLTSEQFSEGLLMEGKVAAIPGNAFGASGEGYVRMAYANSLANIEEALDRIDRFVQKQKR